MYSQRSLSTIFPPHIVASMAFIEKTVSFPWLSLQVERNDVFKSGKIGYSERLTDFNDSLRILLR